MKEGINRDGQDEQDKEILDLRFQILDLKSQASFLSFAFILLILSILLDSALHDSHHSFILYPSSFAFIATWQLIYCAPPVFSFGRGGSRSRVLAHNLASQGLLIRP
jgi:hypothetical protein